MPKIKQRPQAEARADVLVPAIQRATIRHGDQVIRRPIAELAEWDDPSDTNIRSKSPRRVMGYRRSDPLLKYAAIGAGKEFCVTKQHLAAAERLRDDWEIGEGARPGYERPEVGSAPGSGGLNDAQMMARARYTAAICAIGVRQVDIVICVVLHCAEVGAWAESHGVSAHRAMGMLVANLDRLADHYDGVLPRRRECAA